MVSEFTEQDYAVINEAYEDLKASSLKRCSNEQELEVVQKAFDFANNAHKNVRRRSGEPYMLHPIAVAKIVVSDIGLGYKSIAAALLHDVVEDTDYTIDDLRNLFGDKIASLVDGLTKNHRYPGWRLSWTVGPRHCIDMINRAASALDGGPGIYSARYAGEHVTYEDNNALLLKTMENVPDGKRGAAFVSTIALVAPKGALKVPEELTAHGRIDRMFTHLTLNRAGTKAFFDVRYADDLMVQGTMGIWYL